MTITVVRAAGLVTVQDLGRRGHMHEGVPPGGALVPALAMRANRAVGNPDGAPLVEVMGTITIASSVAIAIATDDGARASLAPGAIFTAASREARVRYLAVAGGLDVPELLGGRGALLSGGLGAVLRSGDTLRACAHIAAASSGATASSGVTAVATTLGEGPIAVHVGPDRDAFDEAALERLFAIEWRISPDSDRVGVRLEGSAIARVPGCIERTRPMVRGAIEVPASGVPIVLGPEHPTTGGYPLIGVVQSADLDRFFATPLGARVRFVRATTTDPI